MASATYLGTSDRSVHDAGSVEIDGITLEKDKLVADLSDDQIARLSDMAYHRFDFGGGEKLAGQALDDRVKELGIEGASNMNADQKREAVAKAEAEGGS